MKKEKEIEGKKKPRGNYSKKAEFTPEESKVKFSDVGGAETALKDIRKLVFHMQKPEVFDQLGVPPPRGFLLHGPPGSGKTLIGKAVAGELGLPIIKIAATEIVSGVSGESEQRLREVFAAALDAAPCVLFIDEIDAISPKRENAGRFIRRKVG